MASRHLACPTQVRKDVIGVPQPLWNIPRANNERVLVSDRVFGMDRVRSLRIKKNQVNILIDLYGIVVCFKGTTFFSDSPWSQLTQDSGAGVECFGSLI